ncbi:MAG: hypothetical protein WBA74_02500 [Cyclobacteriaceae bacterium]
MKLRILGNKLRFRLTQQEVKDLAEGQKVSAFVDFPGSDQLQYALYPDTQISAIAAIYAHHQIKISVPVNLLTGWDTDMREGLYHSDDRLDISIEKDFKCLHKRPGEDESDNYPNPLENSTF